MRAVTEPYSPPACAEPASPSRNTERRALDTCAIGDYAIDQRALDAVIADVARFSAAADAEEAIVGLDPSIHDASSTNPAWTQLERLESLLHTWMIANGAVDPAAPGELPAPRPRRHTPAPQPAPITVAEKRSATEYVAQLAARLVRRGA